MAPVDHVALVDPVARVHLVRIRVLLPILVQLLIVARQILVRAVVVPLTLVQTLARSAPIRVAPRMLAIPHAIPRVIPHVIQRIILYITLSQTLVPVPTVANPM